MGFFINFLYSGDFVEKRKWVDEYPSSVTVCNKDGIIIDMNEAATKMFEKDGGKELIGTNLLDCHPEPSLTMLKEMLEKGTSNIYTVQKNGKKKLISQLPWYENGAFAGLVEIHTELPDDMKHFNRDE